MLKRTAFWILAVILAMIVLPVVAQDINSAKDAAATFDDVGYDSWSSLDVDSHLFGNTGDQLLAPLAFDPSHDRFVFDTRFSGDGSSVHEFSDLGMNDQADKQGRKALRMSNGDVLTVALVPKYNATETPPSSIGWNIGMVRYSPEGVARIWDKAAAGFLTPSRQAFLFPNSDEYNSNGSFTEINDVLEYNGWIWVLVTRRAGPANLDVRVVRFSLNDSRWRWDTILATTANENGVGFNIYKDGGVDKLTVVLRRDSGPGEWETWMAGYIVNSNASLTLDTAFGVNGVKDATWCASCLPRAIAPSTTAGVLYVVGDHYRATSPYDRQVYVTKHDKRGYRYSSFADDGIKTFGFDVWGGDLGDYARGIVVDRSTNSMFVLARVNTECNTQSVGIAKLDRTTGALDTSFSSTGKTVKYGGKMDPDSTTCDLLQSYVAQGITINGNRIAVVGSSFNETLFLGAKLRVGGPSLYIVDKDSGTFANNYAFKPASANLPLDGADSEYASVAPSGSDGFYLVGTVKIGNNHKNRKVVTSRMRADRIFADGLD